MSEERILRHDGTRSVVLCGYPECERDAESLLTFTWYDTGWTGLVGACWEHHEDLAVAILGRRVEEGPEVPRD